MMAQYCSVGDVKSGLNITSSNDDVIIDRLITAGSRWIDRYCDLPENGFAQSATATRYYTRSSLDDCTLYLDLPLMSVTSVTNGDSTSIAAQYYRLHPRNADYYYEMRLLSTYATGWTFTDGDSEIIVVGAWGIATVTPSPVREAAAMLAGWMHKRWQAALQDASANFDLGQLVYSKPLPDDVRALLSPYKRIVMGGVM